MDCRVVVLAANGSTSSEHCCVVMFWLEDRLIDFNLVNKGVDIRVMSAPVSSSASCSSAFCKVTGR